MDWNETDPQPLRLTPNTPPPDVSLLALSGANQPASESGNKVTNNVDNDAETQRAVGGHLRYDMAEKAAAETMPNGTLAAQMAVETVLGQQQSGEFSNNLSASNLSHDVMSAAAAEIWQRLSFLVRSPARFDGAWPFLIPLAGMALLSSLAMGNGWFALAWGLALAAGFKISHAHAQNENARDALNMAPLDLRWVGPLAQALHSPHPRVRGVAAQLLTHLLPHLRPHDAGLLNPQQRDYLNQKLYRNRRRDSDLNKAILAAWVNVGDAEAVHYVERLSRANAFSAEKQQVRAAARDCLPRLEQRLEQERAAQIIRAQAALGLAASVENSVPFAPPTLSANSQAAIAEVDSQLDKLREERRKHSNPGMRLGFLIASWVFIVPFTAFQTWLAFAKLQDWGLGLMWAFLTLLATQLHRFSLSSKQTEAARRLALTEDIRAVGPLAEALDWPDTSIRITAAQGLTRLLPRLTASDANLLNAKQRGILYGTLRMRNVHSDGNLIAAVLKALQQVGDEAAVPVVERLAKAHAYTGNQKRIRQLAEDTLPLLTANARNAGASAQLLRASSGNDTPSNLLLRGAMAAPEDAPQQLLRASASEETA